MNFETFKKQFQKVPVEHYPNDVPGEPTVSVCVQTYQHVDYINDCLDGILMQKTDFSFEILLGEDASTDGTREICIKYAEKHSDKIRLFLHHRGNNIKINGQSTGRFNALYNLFKARGKYIALCPGDDYWTDNLKLQKQFDFMTRHSECSACIHDAYLYSETEKSIIGLFSSRRIFRKMCDNKQILRLNDIMRYWHSGPTVSFFLKNIITTFPEWIFKCHGNDTPTMILLAKEGNIGIIKDAMAVYRIHNVQSVTGRPNNLKLIKFKIKGSFYLLNFFDFWGKLFVAKRIGKQLLLGIRYLFKKSFNIK